MSLNVALERAAHEELVPAGRSQVHHTVEGKHNMSPKLVQFWERDIVNISSGTTDVNQNRSKQVGTYKC